MGPAPLIILNGYPGVGKAAVASALRELTPDSRFLQNHSLIDPVAALFEREEPGYRDLRKALRTPVLNSIAKDPVLQQRTIITTYYQETLETREIDLKEHFESAKGGGRPFVVFILKCSPDENIRRLLSRSSSSNSRLSDVNILTDIRQNHFVYSFFEDGYKSPDVWEYQLDIENVKPEEAAHKILQILKDGPGAHDGRSD